jgi:cellulose synthase/poly-beta-1,6-N-acetylglucosamine synthase-like glycosyltransferase
MTVSIIIAVKEWQDYLKQCIERCLQLDYQDFEIIILPDHEGDVPGGIPVKVIPTGPLTPAKKRDIAMSHACGEILAFIDDDAYPRKDWLKNAMQNFADPEVAAVAGPAVTPDADSPRQQASGLVYASAMVSGSYSYRYLPKNRRWVEDYPSCNFLVRKLALQELGGFNTNFWPGEDTKLCFDIINKLKKKIIYDPGVLVYHHRRPLFIPHLKQIASYALHRGYFAKRFCGTSLKLAYFMPSLLLLAVILGAFFSLFSHSLRMIYFSGAFFYILAAIVYSAARRLSLTHLVFCGIILTHLTYGFYFLKGLASSRLKEEEIRA